MDTDYTNAQIEALDALKANGFYEIGCDFTNGLLVSCAKNLPNREVAQVVVDSQGLCNRLHYAQYIKTFYPPIPQLFPRFNAHNCKRSLFCA